MTAFAYRVSAQKTSRNKIIECIVQTNGSRRRAGLTMPELRLVLIHDARLGYLCSHALSPSNAYFLYISGMASNMS